MKDRDPGDSVVNSIIELRSISKSFGGIQALYDISFRVEAGSIHAVIGPNGAGTVSYTHLTLPTIYSV